MGFGAARQTVLVLAGRACGACLRGVIARASSPIAALHGTTGRPQLPAISTAEGAMAVCVLASVQASVLASVHSPRGLTATLLGAVLSSGLSRRRLAPARGDRWVWQSPQPSGPAQTAAVSGGASFTPCAVRLRAPRDLWRAGAPVPPARHAPDTAHARWPRRTGRDPRAGRWMGDRGTEATSAHAALRATWHAASSKPRAEGRCLDDRLHPPRTG